MRKQAGQAFILVLILLGIGALLVVPALRLTGTSLKSSQIVDRQVKGLYAADAAQEYILWKLLYDLDWRQEKLKNNDDFDEFNFYVCDVPVSATVIMRAVEGKGGTTLATDDKIKPTKTVSPNAVLNNTYQTYTYTIRLEQLSSDNTQGLDAVYDILPAGFKPSSSDYIEGSSYLSVDGGSWEAIPDPDVQTDQNQLRLVWPADYDWETGTGAFSSDPLDTNHYFYGIRDFEVRQVKELKFEVASTLPKDEVHCNWVVLKPWNTLSGPQAPITVGSPTNPGVCDDNGLLEVTKSSDPEIIQPGVATPVEYTIFITNLDGFTHQIKKITDYLPPEFYYTAGSTSGITTSDPITVVENINGVDRQRLRWSTDELPGGQVSIHSGETLTLTFWAKATKDVSGSYYNEVIVIPDAVNPKVFEHIGVEDSDFSQNYSWNSGVVIVPAYDSTSEAEGITIDANMSLVLGGITITSWQVD